MCAVVVTRDRRELLRECLTRLHAQQRRVDEVLVIDNQSSDGTSEMVRADFPQVTLISLDENVGGAGGFHRGMREAYDRGHAWLWLMDDDTFAEPDTLERLLGGWERAPSGDLPLLVASRVLWKDGRLHPMNEPWPRWRWHAEMARAVERRLVLLRHTTFVSVAFRREAVEQFGLPLAHYFIWTDDFEYTGRVLRERRGYLVPDSTVVHSTAEPHSPVTGTGGRFYYFVRNSLLLLRGDSMLAAERLHYARLAIRMVQEYLSRNGRSREALATVWRGARDGLRDPVR